jgi:hypothetical protein
VETTTFSLPTASANPTMRSATSSVCSTTLVESVTAPGRMTIPSGSFTSRQTFRSCSCPALAASTELHPSEIARQG